MSTSRREFLAAALTAAGVRRAGAQSPYDVRAFGAAGDGRTIDTPAVNKAIETAGANGGGTVRIPPGIFVCYSIHLKSKVTLYLDEGATIVAGTVPLTGTTSGGFDPAEPFAPPEQFQDYGHSHWHNSMIWGENLEDIGIVGPGRIWGRGISVGRPKGYTEQTYDENELTPQELPGVANKAIALKNCRNVILRDFSMLQGGNFCVLASAVDHLTIENLKIDTNRDGIDIDCCRNVRISDCSINSPYDDAITPKSSYFLGYPRATENVTIANCYLTGAYVVGSMLDGTWKRWPDNARVHRNGRLKCGTESNGAFRNIAISNCVFEGGWGFALESVDGAALEDIVFTGITMRDIANVPLFLRLGSRLRAPNGTKPGACKRILMSDIVSYNCAAPLGGGGVIAGIPGHAVEDVKISDCYFEHRGGGARELAGRLPPENESAYPDPDMFGALPSSGFFARHVRNLEFTNVEISSAAPDARPVFWLSDIEGVDLIHVKTPPRSAGNTLRLSDVRDLRVQACRNLRDVYEPRVPSRVL